jgi:hypothetical protein
MFDACDKPEIEMLTPFQAKWDEQIASGQMDSTQYKSHPAKAPVLCTDGKAVVGDDTFQCDRVSPP